MCSAYSHDPAKAYSFRCPAIFLPARGKGAAELAENKVSVVRTVIKFLEGESSTYCTHHICVLYGVIVCQQNVALCHHSV